MMQFNHLELQLMMNNQLDLENDTCPVYHCITGFKHPQLKPYLSVFNQGVIKQRKLILQTLNQDKDPERRAAAAFLIGHFQNPKDILSLLMPHVNDSNDHVRNNVMRVIFATMEKAKISKIDTKPFLHLLDSPYSTDRNKALAVLLRAAEDPQTQQSLRHNGRDKLLALLALKQPNNHHTAYLILKKISGKNFDEHNIAAWGKWLSEANK